MTPAGRSITLHRGNLYRVYIADGHVVSFDLTYRFPAYTRERV